MNVTYSLRVDPHAHTRTYTSMYAHTHARTHTHTHTHFSDKSNFKKYACCKLAHEWFKSYVDKLIYVRILISKN